MEQTKRLVMSLLAVMLCTMVFAQSDITGTVVDSQGEPIIGATVVVKGSAATGTVTDYDGNFKLKVEAGKTLVFSYVGYDKQELPAQNKS